MAVRCDELVAVRCDKFHERPLIGSICEIFDDAVQIEWYIGTYSGTWKMENRSEGKYVRFQEHISLEDVLMREIRFTKSMRIPLKTASSLKELYM